MVTLRPRPMDLQISLLQTLMLAVNGYLVVIGRAFCTMVVVVRTAHNFLRMCGL